MKNIARIFKFLVLGIFLWSGSAFASDITNFDGTSTGTGLLGAQEDQQVEPVCVETLKWDFEAFDIENGCQEVNDNHMESTTPVPEPATMFIFGTGLIGIVTIGRKKFRKNI